MNSNILLSIIIPAHNEEDRLPPTLTKIHEFLSTQSYRAEVIVVENGSGDRTADVVREYANLYPYMRLLKVQTRGKGLAVKAGMLAAHGEYRFICDADLSMPIDELKAFLTPENMAYDVLIATREGSAAKRIDEPLHRHLIGRVANWLIQRIILPGFNDTQCGFKMFKRAAAEDLFCLQRLNGIGFDVELIFLALKREYRIREIPIVWYHEPNSRISLFKDSLKMFKDISTLKRNWQNGEYGILPIESEQPLTPALKGQ